MTPHEVIRDFDVVVIGGGIMGVSTAWALCQQSRCRVAVIEQATIGHVRGSSNGRVRIARATYADPGYVRLMLRARAEAWSSLENQLGHRLIRPVDGCFFGPEGGLVDAYAKGVETAGGPASRLTNAQASHLFGPLRLTGCTVVHDRSAGVIDATATRAGLQHLLEDAGVVIHCDTTVSHLEADGAGLRLKTNAGLFRAQSIVMTAGAWSTRLIPQLESRLMVHRQHIGYYRTEGAHSTPGGDFAWVYLGQSQDEVYYGLPEAQHLLKAAHHRRSGPVDNPDHVPVPETNALTALDRFIGDAFVVPLVRDHASTCPYTSTATDDFVIDVHPEDSRIIVGAGFSGHGFKFGPLVGQILAQRLNGRSSIDEFNSMRHQLSIHGPTGVTS